MYIRYTHVHISSTLHQNSNENFFEFQIFKINDLVEFVGAEVEGLADLLFLDVRARAQYRQWGILLGFGLVVDAVFGDGGVGIKGMMVCMCIWM